MHDNVDISKELQETRLLFSNILLTQGKGDAGAQGKTDDILFNIASDILTKVGIFQFYYLFRNSGSSQTT